MLVPRYASTAEARLQPEYDEKNRRDRVAEALRGADEVLSRPTVQRVLAAAKARQSTPLEDAHLLEDFVDHEWIDEHAADWSQTVKEPDWSGFGYA